MDAIHAWDQPHFDIHVPDRADRADRAVVVFQTSLGWQWGTQELQDTAGGVGGGVASLAEQFF